MSVMRANFQRLFFPGIRENTFKAWKEKEDQHAKIFNVMSSDKAFEEDYTMAGATLFRQTPESTETAADDWKPGYSIRYNHVDFDLRLGYSWQFQRDIQSNVWTERARDLGFSARSTKEVIIADVFNTAFTTLGYDGQPLCSATHPFIRGGGITGQVQSNLLAPADLSVISLRNMLIMFRGFFDETGIRRIDLTPKWLVLPAALEFDGKEILKSPDRPDTANRATNVINNALQVFVWDYLTSPSNWWVTSDKREHKLKVYDREKFHVIEFEREENKMNWVQGGFTFSDGYSDYRGVVGTQGP